MSWNFLCDLHKPRAEHCRICGKKTVRAGYCQEHYKQYQRDYHRKWRAKNKAKRLRLSQALKNDKEYQWLAGNMVAIKQAEYGLKLGILKEYGLGWDTPCGVADKILKLHGFSS